MRIAFLVHWGFSLFVFPSIEPYKIRLNTLATPKGRFKCFALDILSAFVFFGNFQCRLVYLPKT